MDEFLHIGNIETGLERCKEAANKVLAYMQHEWILVEPVQRSIQYLTAPKAALLSFRQWNAGSTVTAPKLRCQNTLLFEGSRACCFGMFSTKQAFQSSFSNPRVKF